MHAMFPIVPLHPHLLVTRASRLHERVPMKPNPNPNPVKRDQGGKGALGACLQALLHGPLSQHLPLLHPCCHLPGE